MRFFEMLLDKLRVNVIVIAVLISLLIWDFGDKLIVTLDDLDVPPEVIIAVLVSLISTGIGGLIAAMIRMFESPQVPADVHERLMKSLREVADDARN